MRILRPHQVILHRGCVTDGRSRPDPRRRHQRERRHVRGVGPERGLDRARGGQFEADAERDDEFVGGDA